MVVNVCPADRVQAPVELVWELLMHPAGYGRFLDLTVERVEPVGPAAAGQRFVGWTRALGRRWRVEGEVLEVDAEQHQIRFRTVLPLGIVGDNRIACMPIDGGGCMLRFGWDFSFPPGWRGLLLERMGARFHEGVADSLQRLKRAAEDRGW